MARRAFVMVGLLTACATETEPIAFENYTAELVDAICRHLATCGQFESLEACDKALMYLDVPLDDNLLAAVEMGKVIFDGAATRACIDGVASLPCEVGTQFRYFPDACHRSIRGTIPAGGACALSSECISQACNVPDCDQACCVGSCFGSFGDPPPSSGEIGEACGDDSGCRNDLYCDAESCAPLLPAGARCQSFTACHVGLDCLSGTCTPSPKIGEPCGAGCGEIGAFCSSTGRCVKYALGGEACGLDTRCSPFYVCDSTSRCRLREGIPLGGACQMGTRCSGPGAFCSFADGQSTGTCAQAQPNGAPCDTNRVCANGSCDPSTQTCIPGPVCI